MLIQKKQFGFLQSCHKQRQRLPLSAGKQSHFACKTVFQSQIKLGEQRLIVRLFLLFHSPPQRASFASAVGNSKIFGNFHFPCSAHHGVLKHSSQKFGSFVVRHVCYVYSVKQNFACVDVPRSANGIEQSAFSCAVSANHSDEIAFLQSEIYVVQRYFFVYCVFVECFAQVANFQHFASPPS